MRGIHFTRACPGEVALRPTTFDTLAMCLSDLWSEVQRIAVSAILVVRVPVKLWNVESNLLDELHKSGEMFTEPLPNLLAVLTRNVVTDHDMVVVLEALQAHSES